MMAIDARVRDQVAEVQRRPDVPQPGLGHVIEAEYLFSSARRRGRPEPGPDGRRPANSPARLLPKDEARRIYEEIVRSRRDPALLEYMGRGLFRASVFPIPPGADRKVTLRYTQLCKTRP